jgi:Fic family protein
MKYQRKYNLTKEENIFVVKRNIVDYIWKSVNLEGIGMTYPDTQSVYNGMSVAGFSIDDINTVNDLKNAWKLLLETIDAPLDLDYIKKIHRAMGKFTIINAGSLRLDPAGIGGTDWIPAMPDKDLIEQNLTQLLSIKDPLERALTVTAYLMRTQAFYDGNKRIAMLIGNKIMISNGEGVISVKQRDIPAFYDTLITFYETGEYDAILQFLYENCIDGMNISKPE